MATRVLADANVLHSRALRDWLILLCIEAQSKMFSLHYTVDILAETIASLRRRFPDLPGEQMEDIHNKITNCMTSPITKYPSDPDAPLADPKDRHVHCAAVGGNIQMLITQDTDFLDLPDEVKDTLTYEIVDPDAFFVLIDDSAPELVRAVTKLQADYYTRRRQQGARGNNLVTQLIQARCPSFAERVRLHLQGLFG